MLRGRPRRWPESSKETPPTDGFISDALRSRSIRRVAKVRNLFKETIAEDNFETLWLIPTAEVPLTNLVREDIIDEIALPLRYTAGTPCFRAEAGAAGKDTRGMIRQHQFSKVELVSITTPEQSAQEHERMTACAEEVLKDSDFRSARWCSQPATWASQRTRPTT